MYCTSEQHFPGKSGLQAGLREGSGNGFGCHCGWRVGMVRFPGGAGSGTV